MLSISNLLFWALLWQSPSFIEQSISTAKEEIAKEPNNPEGYNDLTLAYVRKTRETGDTAFLERASAALASSLKLEPANFGARFARAALRLAEHRYEDALEEAQALRKLRPDENLVYGIICQAELELGNYGEAEKAVQRMLDLRSVNAPGFEYGALVRESIGFPEPALEWWQSSLHLISDRDTEERALIYARMARINREMGKYDQASDCAKQALRLMPDYPIAVRELARVRIEEKQYAAAAELLKNRRDLASLYWKETAQEKGGMPVSAEFEKRASSASSSPDNENDLLIRYLAEHGKAAEAVALGEKTLARRHDLFTHWAYAVALARAGNGMSAMAEIKKALEPGYQDPALYFDAATIARQQRDEETAATYFKKAMERAPSGIYADEALKQLMQLKHAPPGS